MNIRSLIIVALEEIGMRPFVYPLKNDHMGVVRLDNDQNKNSRFLRKNGYN
jgi:hypothetical protein